MTTQRVTLIAPTGELVAFTTLRSGSLFWFEDRVWIRLNRDSGVSLAGQGGPRTFGLAENSLTVQKVRIVELEMPVTSLEKGVEKCLMTP